MAEELPSQYQPEEPEETIDAQTDLVTPVAELEEAERSGKVLGLEKVSLGEIKRFGASIRGIGISDTSRGHVFLTQHNLVEMLQKIRRDFDEETCPKKREKYVRQITSIADRIIRCSQAVTDIGSEPSNSGAPQQRSRSFEPAQRVNYTQVNFGK